MSCPDDNALSEFVAGALTPAEVGDIEAHLDQCESCRSLLIEFARDTEDDDDPEHRQDPVATLTGARAHTSAAGSRYVPEEVLGAGGMSIVYRGRDQVLGRQVALKFMLNAPEDVRARLRREARALAMLSHPNVVDVYDLDLSEGSTFLACALVDGGSLRAWLEQQERTTQQIVDVIVDAARGLEAAHRMDLVHRDVSPNNILIGADGRGRVADFGLARLPMLEDTPTDQVGTDSDDSGEASVRRRTGVVGTPAYIAPEVLNGLDAQASADQYSLSVTAYEALHGVLPGEPTKRTIPRAVASVLARGMRQAPEDRFASMTAFRRALHLAVRPRSRMGRFAVGTVVAALGWVAVGAQTPQPPCAGTNPGVPATITVDVSMFEPRVADEVTKYVQLWHQARDRVCDGATERTMVGSALDRRWSCLRDRERDLAVTVETMAAHLEGPMVLSNHFRALEGLDPVRNCDDDEWLTHMPPPPPPSIGQEVASLRERLRRARAKTLWATDESQKEIASVVEAAGQLGFGPLTARALMFRGQFERDRNDLDQARKTLETAALLATGTKADTTAAISWLHIIAIEGYERQDFDAAMRLLPLADAAIARMNHPTMLMSIRERTLAMVYDGKGMYEEAEPHHLEALRWAAELHGEYTVGYSEVLANFGAHYSRRLDPEKAGQRTREALEITRHRLGPDTLNEAILLRNLSVNAIVLENKDDAAAYAQQSLDIMVEHLDADDERLGPFLSAAGEANVATGKSELGIEQLERAVELSEANLPPAHPLLVDARRILGESYAKIGKPVEADRMLERASEQLDKNRPYIQAYLLYDRGKVWTTLGRYGEAAAACERARTIAASIEVDDLVTEALVCRDEAERLAQAPTPTDAP